MKTVDLIDRALDEMPTIRLQLGGHKPGTGTCLMEAVSYISGENHTDHPKCTARALAELGIEINDSCANDRFRNEILKPIIPVLLNTSDREYRKFGNHYDSDHESKIQVFLNKRFKDEFDGAGYSCLGDLLYDIEVSSATPRTKARRRNKVLRTAAKILGEAACYAREQLGKDVDIPIAKSFLR